MHICIKNLYSKYSPHHIDVPEYILKTFSSILTIFPAESVDIPKPLELEEEFVVVKDLYAIAAYNGGIGSVTNWFSKLIYSDIDEFVEQIPYPETKNYVKKVLRTYWVYGNVY